MQNELREALQKCGLTLPQDKPVEVLTNSKAKALIGYILKTPSRLQYVPCPLCYAPDKEVKYPHQYEVKVPKVAFMDVAWVRRVPNRPEIWTTTPWAYCQSCHKGWCYMPISKHWSGPAELVTDPPTIYLWDQEAWP